MIYSKITKENCGQLRSMSDKSMIDSWVLTGEELFILLSHPSVAGREESPNLSEGLVFILSNENAIFDGTFTNNILDPQHLSVQTQFIDYYGKPLRIGYSER